jgi:hypothetical protein
MAEAWHLGPTANDAHHGFSIPGNGPPACPVAQIETFGGVCLRQAGANPDLWITLWIAWGIWGVLLWIVAG